MTSRQHARTRTAAASRTPSLPRRRRWPLPTGANMTERQPRRRCCSAGELALWMTSSVIPTFWRSGGEDLGLLAFELFGRDDSAVTQLGQLGQLVGRGLRTPRGVLDVLAELPVLLLCLLLGALLHAAAAGDQVDQDADQRNEQHEDEPQCLGPAGQVMAAEDIDEDIDQNPDPEHPEEDLENRPERPEQWVRVGTSEWHGDPMSGNNASMDRPSIPSSPPAVLLRLAR